VDQRQALAPLWDDHVGISCGPVVVGSIEESCLIEAVEVTTTTMPLLESVVLCTVSPTAVPERLLPEVRVAWSEATATVELATR